MMRFDTLLNHPADWMLGDATDSGIVLTCRIRLARNLRNFPFPGWAKKAQRIQILEQLRPATENLKEMKSGFIKELSQLDSIEKQVLVERHLISREQAARGEGCAVVINRKQSLSLMLNEEDHLRIQSIRKGLNFKSAYKQINEVDNQLETQLPYAFDTQLGYLTACPTNLGTGMRASAMLHLPALVISDHISQVVTAANKLGLAVRGLHGEGTESMGNVFQVSNQTTLGESEASILKRLERVIKQITSHEHNARLKLVEEDSTMLLDRIGRAYGTLKYAYNLTSKEALQLLSLIRLGGDLGLLPQDTTRPLCDALLLELQPAHLQLRAGYKLPAEERDLMRAELIRERLQSLPSPAINFNHLSEDVSSLPPTEEHE